MKENMHGGDIYRNSVLMDFSVNVNPFGMPLAVRKKIIENIDCVSVYPDIENENLIAALAKYYKINSENILVGNGASELINGICHGLKPENALLIAPGYLGYKNALENANVNINFWKLKEENDYKIADELDGIIEYLRENKTEILFVTNPNNPTGEVIELEKILRLANICKESNTILVIDECFMELTKDGNTNSFIHNYDAFENVIILRAFTKTYALAGIRLGYAITRNKNYILEIKKHLPEWNISAIASLAGVEALKAKEYLYESNTCIEEQRKYLEESLQKMGFTVYKSGTNFILFSNKNENKKLCKNLYKELLDKKILIRDCSNYAGLKDGFYRIAVKTEAENIKLIEAINSVLENENANILEADFNSKMNSIEYVLPGDIEKRSFEIIGKELLEKHILINKTEEAVTKRAIHTSADFEYATTMTYSKNAIKVARNLIKNGADIVTDTNMAKAGINKTRLAKYGGEVHCFMADEDVAREAKERGVTRATVSMERAAKLNKPVIFAIGNAPTALISLYEMMEKNIFKPEFVIGVPVGFVNVEAAKELFVGSEIPYIINRGRKGGSNIAAAICNALLYGIE